MTAASAISLLASVLYLLLYIVCGCTLALVTLARTGISASRAAVVFLGCCFGTALLAVLPALIALLTGFRLTAALTAGCLTMVLLFAALHFTPRNRLTEQLSHRDYAFLALCLAPFGIITLWLLYTHILQPINGELWTGQSCYGDLAMHLSFIKSIAVKGRFPPTYPLLAEQTLFGYPFLCESISSVFLLFGVNLRTAYILPEIPAFCALYGLFWLLARQVLHSAEKASLAFWLFFCGSGLGFFWFCGSWESFRRIFMGYYTTPTNYVEENIRWVNPLADMLIPQRATLFGWALLLGCLFLLWFFTFEGHSALWLPIGLLAGCLPLIHTHSFLALVLLCAVWFGSALWRDRENRPALWITARPWLQLAAAAGLLSVPQLFGIIFQQTGSGQNFLRLHFNWANDGDFYLWFYIKNIGLVYVLLIPAFLHAKSALRQFYGGTLLILVLAELVVFQPNTYDNNKLLFVWHMLGCILVSDLILDSLQYVRQKPLRWATGAAAMWLGTFGSVLTLGREAVSSYRLFSADCIAVAAYIDENSSPDALFCTGTHHLNPIVSLAGRDILCGSSLYVYYHGMNYARQESAVHAVYEKPDRELLAKWNIDYVSISNWERSSYVVDEDFYAENYTVWYQNGSYTIYKIR